MTARPPRASSKSDGKRAKTRAGTQSERSERAERERADKRRAPSLLPTDRFEAVSEIDVVESLDDEVPLSVLAGRPGPQVVAALGDVIESREIRRLRVLVLDDPAYLTAAQDAIVAAGHMVAGGTAGRAADKLRSIVGEVDVMLVGLPGGEPVIEAALALGPRRPIVIAASTSSAVEAARRAAAGGADLATVRPHHVERMAPILFAADRLIEERHARLAASTAPPPLPELPELPELDDLPELAELPEVADVPELVDEASDAEPGTLVSFKLFQEVSTGELERADRYGYPLAVAMFSVEIPATPPPPPGLRGILRARAGNALVQAIRDIDLATEQQDRFIVLMPYTERLAGAEVARRIISAVAAVDPVVAGGRPFSPRLIGAVAGARPGAPRPLSQLIQDVTQLVEQAQVTGASLAVET